MTYHNKHPTDVSEKWNTRELKKIARNLRRAIWLNDLYVWFNKQQEGAVNMKVVGVVVVLIGVIFFAAHMPAIAFGLGLAGLLAVLFG